MKFRARIPSWAVAREAAAMMGLDHTAEMRLRAQLERTLLVFEVDRDGKAKIEGYEVEGATRER